MKPQQNHQKYVKQEGDYYEKILSASSGIPDAAWLPCRLQLRKEHHDASIWNGAGRPADHCEGRIHTS